MDKKFAKITSFQKFLLFVLIFLGTICLSLTTFRSGREQEEGIAFWGPNGHDGVWHIALANQSLKSFPPPCPVFSGFKLTNYHFFYDLLLALSGQLTKISLFTLHFRFYPVLFAFLLGVLSFMVGYLWRRDFWTGFWLCFLNYFAGSFGWIATLAREGRIGGESLFWSMQSISTLLNPPFALSLIFLLGGMLFLLSCKGKSWKEVLLGGVIFGVIINIKAYGGVVALAGLASLAFFAFRKGRLGEGKVFLTATVVSSLIFFLTNRSGASLFIFKPFWFIHTMLEARDRLFLPRLALARYALLASSLGPKLILIEVIGLGLFLVGNLGGRIFGLLALGKRLWQKRVTSLDSFLGGGMLVSLFLPLLFIQKGTAWNTIQFFYYFLFLMNFYFAAFLADLTKTASLKEKIFLGVLLVITIPTSFSTLRDYLGKFPPAVIPSSEVVALTFLRNQLEGVVLTFPYQKEKKRNGVLVPLRFYETTAYVSALTGKISFLEDEMNLEITGYPWRERKREIEKFFSSRDEFWARGFLVNNQIDYIYLVAEEKLPLPPEKLGLKVIFNKGGVRIYKVLR